MKSILSLLIFGLINYPGSVQAASVNYYKGEVKVHLYGSHPCYVEVDESLKDQQLIVKAITPLEHLSSTGEITWISVGAYAAALLPGKNIYRYQNATPGAPIKDLVINVGPQRELEKLSLLYWHAEASHYDPIRCLHLTRPSSSQEADEIAKLFN